MDQNDLPRHQLIKDLMSSPPVGAADSATAAWEQMASQIIPIVGEEGFNALLERTVFLNKALFPWLPAGRDPPGPGHLAALKKGLEVQARAQASEANILLLITFTDIIASLIGEQLTTRILRLAWCANIPDSTAKESRNE